MYQHMLPVQICYHFYAGFIMLALIFGISLLLFAFFTLHGAGLGGTEVALTFIFSTVYCLVRAMISAGATSVSYYDDYTAISSKDLAINTFVMKEMEDNATSCPICLEDYNIGESVSVVRKCSHIFHTECLDMWISQSKHTSCPYCRQGIEKRCCLAGSSNVHKTGAWGIFNGIFDSVYG
jgi:hypothetical protein